MTEDTIKADIAQLQRQADEFVLKRNNKLNAKQQASLNKLLARIAKLHGKLAAESTTPEPTGRTAVEIGPEPLTNNSTPVADGTYTCPQGFNAEEFTAKYGADVLTILNRVITAIIRPKLDRFNLSGIEPGTKAQALAADATRQVAWVGFMAGSVPLTEAADYLGTWIEYLGCVNPADLRDLGPQ